MDTHFAVAYIAIEQRRRALTAEASFGAGHGDALIQPGIDEALACQDMLQPASAHRSRIAHLIMRLKACVSVMACREPAAEYRPALGNPHGTS